MRKIFVIGLLLTAAVSASQRVVVFEEFTRVGG